MAESDRWNDRRYRDRERGRSYRMEDLPDYGQTDYSGGYESDYRGEYSYGRPRGDFRRAEDRDDNHYAPFGASGPVEGRDRFYDDRGEPYGGYRRSEYRSGHASDYSRDREHPYFRSSHPAHYDVPYGQGYADDQRGGRMEERGRRVGREARSWWDRTADKIGSAFSGDDRADRDRDYHAGEYRGRGPKGYRRSDERIHEDVSDRLADDPYLDASEVEVQVAEGEVTLTGSVQRRSDKRRAEELTEAILGVTHVQNNLRAQNNDRDDDRYGSWTRGLAWGGPF